MAKTLGRKPLTDAQIKAVDDRISATMRQLARTDPEWQAKSRDERVMAASEQAMADIQAEAARKVENTQRQILKTAATETRITDTMAGMKEGRNRALVNDIDQTGHYINGIKQEAVGNLVNLMDAARGGEGAGFGRRVLMFLFDADNPGMTRDLSTEIFRNGDGSTGNKVAQLGAQAYLKVIETLRQRFNSAGGDVGRLEYGYIPQPHDAGKVRGAGGDAARQAWVDKILPLLDRGRYVDEAGARLGDADVRALLGKAWETISSDGANKREPGAFGGGGAKANAGSESRQIHFKDADSYLTYMQQFGTGSMYDAVIGHVGRMARDIGLVERYGPNPNAQMRLQMDLAERADGGVKRDFGLRPESYWDQINGTAGTPQSAKLAQIGTDARNIQTFGKLGSAVISSITDLGTFAVTTGFNKLSYWDAIANIGKSAASKDARDFMTTHGIIAESMIGDMNRWTGDNIRQTWSGRLANSTMKLSLMNAWTDTLRRAFSLTMMQGMARLSKTEWGKLGEWDRTHLERKGITEADWQVITKAELTHFQGKDHLTPEAIRATGHERADEVVAKVLGLIQDESEYAVLNPDLATKTIASGGATQRGTIRGELARSVMQFKSFPIAMVSRHWRRMLEAPKVTDGSAPVLANRVMYAGALMLSTTALGAIALQAKQIIGGKDPIDMQGEHAGKFWAKAVAQGGGLSIVGDFLLNDPADQPGDSLGNLTKTAAGPALGAVGDLAGKTLTNAYKAAKGKPTHAAAEGLQWVRSNTPYTGIWYARAALDHAGMHALQENLSPGYLSKMKQRASKDFGQQYWWNPGTGGPDRAPDMAKAVGQ
ncbi:hypothetical protein [Variovorax sp. PBS-H4]|uniref:hypothetical protein n=1 Tax=Variovorax sp. PBS-H4 TaxID=434008 RepID=UPI0013A582D4|nr:hypothetical protein [Variovorax sp. PBS-H4]